MNEHIIDYGVLGLQMETFYVGDIHGRQSANAFMKNKIVYFAIIEQKTLYLFYIEDVDPQIKTNEVK